MTAALKSAMESTADESSNSKSSQRQLSIDRVYKDNALKELILERQKVKSITIVKDKLLHALNQVKSTLKHEQDMDPVD